VGRKDILRNTAELERNKEMDNKRKIRKKI
jgi:hypothetical protein